MIRVRLPAQLRALARVDGEVEIAVAEPVTLAKVLDALEAAYPPLAGTIRNRATGRRRALIRLFADGEDLSDAPPTDALPEVIHSGRQPLLVVGAIAGG